MADCCALHIMLLVLFFHSRALLLLPQCSHSSDTGSSRAPLKTAYAGQHGLSAMECIVVYWSRVKFPIPVTQVCIIYGCARTYCTHVVWIFEIMGSLRCNYALYHGTIPLSLTVWSQIGHVDVVSPYVYICI